MNSSTISLWAYKKLKKYRKHFLVAKLSLSNGRLKNFVDEYSCWKTFCKNIMNFSLWSRSIKQKKIINKLFTFITSLKVSAHFSLEWKARTIAVNLLCVLQFFVHLRFFKWNVAFFQRQNAEKMEQRNTVYN